MGVPTLTFAGDSIAQRLGATRMIAAGLEAFVAESESQYVECAVDWARRRDELARLRAGLRRRMDDVAATQPAQVAAALQQRLRQMWRRWCAGLPPERLS